VKIKIKILQKLYWSPKMKREIETLQCQCMTEIISLVDAAV